MLSKEVATIILHAEPHRDGSQYYQHALGTARVEPVTSDVNPVDGDHDRNVILLVVESFNN